MSGSAARAPDPVCIHGVELYCACDTVFGDGCTQAQALRLAEPCSLDPSMESEDRDNFICVGGMIPGDQTTGNECARVFQNCGLL